jgi:hypothetical protein
VEMLILIGGLCCLGFINPTGVVSRVFLFGPSEYVAPKKGDRIQSPKRRFK